MSKNITSQNPVRNLDQIELQSYLAWYSQIIVYWTLVKLLTLSFSRNKLEEKIFSKLGEVPNTATDQARKFCKDNLSSNGRHRFTKRFVKKLLNSLYISFLLNSWSRKHPRTAYVNKASLFILKLIFEILKKQNTNQRTSTNESRFLTPEQISSSSPVGEFISLQDVLLSGSGLMYQEGALFSIDPAVGECEFQAGLWDKVVFNKSLGIFKLKGQLEKLNSTGRIDFALDLTGRCSSNYWHFMCEYLPRIFNLNDVPTDLPILINSEAPLSCQKLLHLYFPENEIFTIQPEAWIEVGKLTAPKFLTKSLDSGNTFPEDKFSWTDKTYLQALRKMSTSFVASSTFPQAEKIYLKRQSNFRNIENEDKLEAFLVDHGFQIVIPEKLSIEAQVLIFKQSKIVVGIGGAVWANLIYANPNILAISIVSAASAPNDVHAQLSRLLGINFKRVICQKFSKNEFSSFSRLFYRDFSHSSFIIDDIALEELKRILSES